MNTDAGLSQPNSPTVDTLIRDGNVVTSTGMQQMNVGIKDGVIFSLVSAGTAIKAQEVIDASGLAILPGCVDVHVHPRDPGQAHKETFVNLSHAAAVGGITTIFCQPNLAAPITTVERLLQVREYWGETSVVDFAIQAMPDPDHSEEISKLLSAGAISIEFITPRSRDAAFNELLSIVHDNGGVSGVSCTDWDYAKCIQEQSIQKGLYGMMHWLSAYPNAKEAANLARILALTENAPYEMHFHMLSTRQSAELLRVAKVKGRRGITAETAPRYLLLTSGEHSRKGPSSIVVPPLRGADDASALWEAIADCTIDLISSDHAPHTHAEKETNGNIWQASPGLPEIELSLPLMINAARSRDISLCKAVDLMSEAPARRYRIYPKKGAIQIGSDADLVLVDVDKEYAVRNADLLTAPKYSLFDGCALVGAPVMTLIGGDIVARNHRIVNAGHRGKWIQRFH